MRIRNWKKTGVLLLSAVLCVLLSACTPPNYTKEKKKEVTAEFADSAKQWFLENEPAATVKSGEAYHDAVDLYAAISGTYELGNGIYRYLYDYRNGVMYTDEHYAEACGLLSEFLLREFDLRPESSSFSFLGSDLTVGYENDDWYPRNLPVGEDGNPANLSEVTASRRENLMPAGLSAAEFSEKVLSGEASFSLAIDSVVEEYPVYEEEKFGKYAPNLVGIWYRVPMGTEFSGACQKIYSSRGVEEYYASITRLREGLYGGWFYRGVPAFEDSISYENLGKDGFSLVIPEPAEPILLTEKKQRKLKTYFTNSAGEKIEYEADELYRSDCPGFPGCYAFSTEFVAREPVQYAYRITRNSNSGGKYFFK